MQTKMLFNEVLHEGKLPLDEVKLVTQDSRKAKKNVVFVCIKGGGFDGHDFAQKALDAGAVAVVTQKKLGLENEIVVANTRKAYAQLCANFFENPAKKLVMIAVTGTNGKTTISTVLKQLLQNMGVKCGLIGTIQNEINNICVPAKFTTPDAWDLNALLARMAVAGCTHVVMEASSQALQQGRVLGLWFKLAIFSNLTQDHLDYHKTMEAYFEAKKIIFSQSEQMLANFDDEWGKKLLLQNKQSPMCETAKSFSYKGMQEADFVAKDVRLLNDGIRFAWLGDDFLLPLTFPMLGEYSVSNALAVASAGVMLGFMPLQINVALAKSKGVAGRCEVIYSGKFVVIRDFAHTADGILQILQALRPFAKKRLIALYGCTGERDSSKWENMGLAAAKYADVIFLSSDNPRSENPDEIIALAKKPLEKSGKPFFTHAQREKAIENALGKMEEDDVLVLCGKGHEDYQVLNDITCYMNEKQIVENWVKSNIK